MKISTSVLSWVFIIGPIILLMIALFSQNPGGFLTGLGLGVVIIIIATLVGYVLQLRRF